MDILNIIKGPSLLEFNEKNNLLAKKALTDFTKELSKAVQSKEYEVYDTIHSSYYIFLYLLRKELDDNNYIYACSEIRSLAHRDDLFQGRVMYNLIYILKEHFRM